MTVPDLVPIVMRDAVLTVAGEDYSSGIARVEFIPTPSVTWTTQYQGPPVPHLISVSWQVVVSYVQDFESRRSLLRFILTHIGETHTVAFTPKAGGSAVTATIVVVPGQLGGVPNQHLTATVTFPIDGTPVLDEVE